MRLKAILELIEYVGTKQYQMTITKDKTFYLVLEKDSYSISLVIFIEDIEDGLEAILKIRRKSDVISNQVGTLEFIIQKIKEIL